MENLKYTLVMLAAGIGIPLLAALNAQLGARIGAPTAAAAVLFAVALTATLAATLLTGAQGGFSALAAQPPHLFAAGLLVAFYVLSVTWIAPRFGVGNAILCVLLGQMLSAAVIDHFGLFYATVRPFTALRAAGLATMAAGLILTRFG
jgi:bacterial/archaeal transporter family-2 protein